MKKMSRNFCYERGNLKRNGYMGTGTESDTQGSSSSLSGLGTKSSLQGWKVLTGGMSSSESYPLTFARFKSATGGDGKRGRLRRKIAGGDTEGERGRFIYSERQTKRACKINWWTKIRRREFDS